MKPSTWLLATLSLVGLLCGVGLMYLGELTLQTLLIFAINGIGLQSAFNSWKKERKA